VVGVAAEIVTAATVAVVVEAIAAGNRAKRFRKRDCDQGETAVGAPHFFEILSALASFSREYDFPPQNGRIVPWRGYCTTVIK